LKNTFFYPKELPSVKILLTPDFRQIVMVIFNHLANVQKKKKAQLIPMVRKRFISIKSMISKSLKFITLWRVKVSLLRKLLSIYRKESKETS
jgi:hypothetical protein